MPVLGFVQSVLLGGGGGGGEFFVVLLLFFSFPLLQSTTERILTKHACNMEHCLSSDKVGDSVFNRYG